MRTLQFYDLEHKDCNIILNCKSQPCYLTDGVILLLFLFFPLYECLKKAEYLDAVTGPMHCLIKYEVVIKINVKNCKRCLMSANHVYLQFSQHLNTSNRSLLSKTTFIEKSPISQNGPAHLSKQWKPCNVPSFLIISCNGDTFIFLIHLITQTSEAKPLHTTLLSVLLCHFL